uniref:Fibronectin type-III domain-containing protein n=1 Tax=Biomphalaria glabrata TaxID=6526 RepID=A0A2C9LT81_BIOGL
MFKQRVICFFLLWSAMKAATQSGAYDTDNELADLQEPIMDSVLIAGKSYFYVGERLELRCNLSTKYIGQGYTAQNISFTKTTPSKPKTNVTCVENQVVDESTAMLVINNVSVDDSGTYYCLLGDCNSHQLIGNFNDIKVEYKPKEVENLLCYLYNWKEYIYCTWQLSEPYVGNDTHVQFVFNSDQTQDVVQNCPNLTKTSCRLDFSGSSIYIIEISVINSKTKDNASIIYIMEINESVKPAPVDRVTTEGLGDKGCFNISWSHSAKNWSKFFLVYIQQLGSTDWKLIENGTSEYLKICDIGPYVPINVSVFCCPNHPYSGYCSNPSNFSYTTPQVAPLFGPETLNGSYITQNCINGAPRNVTIFWKDVIKTAQNGLISAYQIKYSSSVVNLKSDKYQATIQLPCHSSAEVEISAINSAGRSVQPTSLLIAPLEFQVPEIIETSLALEMKNGLVQAHWDTNNISIYSYTLFWCQAAFTGYCKGEIFWKSIPSNQSSTTISIFNPLEFNFGLAVTDEDRGKTSPMVWFECYYDPDKSLPKINGIDVLALESSVTVKWDPLKCSKSFNYKVTNYIIKYCVINLCSDSDVKTIEVESTKSFYKISNLDAETKYQVSLSAKSENTSGLDSEWIQFQPIAPKSIVKIVVPIVLGTTFAIVIIVLATILYRKCSRSHKKFRTLNFEKDAIQIEGYSPVCTNMKSIDTEKAIEIENLNIKRNDYDLVIQDIHSVESSDSSASSSDSRSRLIEKTKTQSRKLEEPVEKNNHIRLNDISVGLIPQIGPALNEGYSSQTECADKETEIPQYFKFKDSSPESTAQQDTESSPSKTIPLETVMIVQKLNGIGEELSANFESLSSVSPCLEYMALDEENTLVTRPKHEENPADLQEVNTIPGGHSACVHDVNAQSPVVLGGSCSVLLSQEISEPHSGSSINEHCYTQLKQTESSCPTTNSNQAIRPQIRNNLDNSRVVNTENVNAHVPLYVTISSEPNQSESEIKNEFECVAMVVRNNFTNPLSTDTSKKSNLVQGTNEDLAGNTLIHNLTDRVLTKSSINTPNTDPSSSNCLCSSDFLSNTDPRSSEFLSNTDSSGSDFLFSKCSSSSDFLSNTGLNNSSNNLPTIDLNKSSNYLPNTGLKKSSDYLSNNGLNNQSHYLPDASFNNISDYLSNTGSNNCSDYLPNTGSRNNSDYLSNTTPNHSSDHLPNTDLNNSLDYLPNIGLNNSLDYLPNTDLNNSLDYLPNTGLNNSLDYLPNTCFNNSSDYLPNTDLNNSLDYFPNTGVNNSLDYLPNTGLNNSLDYLHNTGFNNSSDYLPNTDLNNSLDYLPNTGLNNSPDYLPNTGLNNSSNFLALHRIEQQQ